MIQDRIERLAFYFSFEKNYKNLVQLIKLIIIILFIGHFFACFWHGLGLVEIYYFNRSDTWIHAKNLVNSDIYVKYIYSIYFLAATMITVGYGDITPQNEVECAFVVFTMIITGMVYAYSLNSIGNIISDINKLNQSYNNDMQTIHKYLKDENVDSELSIKVSNYLEYLYKVIKKQSFSNL